MDSVQPQPNPPAERRQPADAVPPFPAIFHEYGSFVGRTLRAHGVPEGYLDDACQEVFLTVFRRLKSFEGRSTLRTWIYGICIRVSMNCLRRAHMRREIPVDVLPEGGGAAPQERELESQQLADRLGRVLSQLAPDRREVYRLYELEGLTMPEVARVMACPLSTAYSRLHAARRQVEAAMHEPSAGHPEADPRRQTEPQREGRQGRRRELALGVAALEWPPRATLARMVERLPHSAAAGSSASGGVTSLISSWKAAAAAAALGLASTGALHGLPAVQHAHAAPAVLVSTPSSELSPQGLVARHGVPALPQHSGREGITGPAQSQAAAQARPQAAAQAQPQAAAQAQPSHEPARARKRPSARRSRSGPKARAHLTGGEALALELSLLRKAQRLLDARPARALALVHRHERDFEHSAFVQERETLAIEALLRAGRAQDAQARAGAFQRRFPSSAYGRRIADLMASPRGSREGG